MSEIDTSKIWLANFVTSSDASQLGKELFHKLGFSAHYQIARLAIGRSLGENTFPESAPDARGNTIKGNLLFGDEQQGGLLWLGLLIENISKHKANTAITLDTLQHAVRDHWLRGILLLQQDWEEAGDYGKFVELLITRRAVLSSDDNFIMPDDYDSAGQLSAKPVRLTIGQDKDTNELVSWLVNGKGYAPNVALMGQAGSGKTRTMLSLIKQAYEETNAPVILLDLGKGELADNHELVATLNAKIIRVPEQAIPLDMFQKSDEPDSPAHILQGFRDSFERSMQSKPGAKQLDAFREALKPLFQQQDQITIQDIKNALDRYYSEKKIKTDSVMATINDLIQFKLFEPSTAPNEFFTQNWIITFGQAQDTTKKLASSLLIDALHNYLKRCKEAPIDTDGHRGLRLILAIDESRSLLTNRHPGLSNLLRLHRSKGLCVMLASQSPDDYEGAADDYLEQIGLPICFRTNATSSRILNNMFGQTPNFSSLESGVCLSVLEPGGSMRKIKAF